MATKSQRASSDVLRFFDDLVRSETRLYNSLNERLREKHDIVGVQFELLRYLRDHPDSRVADVAGNFAAGIGAISKGVDRLESHNLVQRVPNPADRRSSLLELTGPGEKLVAEAEITFADHVRSVITNALTVEQLAAAAEAVSTLRAVLESEKIGLPVG